MLNTGNAQISTSLLLMTVSRGIVSQLCLLSRSCLAGGCPLLCPDEARVMKYLQQYSIYFNNFLSISPSSSPGSIKARESAYELLSEDLTQLNIKD